MFSLCDIPKIADNRLNAWVMQVIGASGFNPDPGAIFMFDAILQSDLLSWLLKQRQELLHKEREIVRMDKVFRACILDLFWFVA